MKTIPLHSAAFVENFEVVQKLIEYDADIDARDNDGCPRYIGHQEVVISKMVLSFDYCWIVVQV